MQFDATLAATAAGCLAGHAPGRTVIALHCSGADARQWNALSEALGPMWDVVTPEQYGCARVGPWTGTHAFALADEAARTLPLIDRTDGPVHLVGHSYGGGLALHLALARRERIASIALYEPSAFHLLARLGPHGSTARAEITAVAQAVSAGVLSGDYRAAAAVFIDYWGGAGAWRALRPALQDAITRWIPKAPLDFAALLQERGFIEHYRCLTMPVLVLRGEYAPAPTRLIAEALASVLPHGRAATIAGAGHMGPLTHAAQVNAAIARHIGDAQAPPMRASTSTSAAAG